MPDCIALELPSDAQPILDACAEVGVGAGCRELLQGVGADPLRLVLHAAAERQVRVVAIDLPSAAMVHLPPVSSPGGDPYLEHFVIGLRDSHMARTLQGTCESAYVLVGVSHTEPSPFGSRAPSLFDLLPPSEVRVLVRDDGTRPHSDRRRPYPTCRLD